MKYIDTLVIGAGASDMIAEVGLAIEAGMTAEDIALTIHAANTFCETTMEAAKLMIGRPTHVVK